MLEEIRLERILEHILLSQELWIQQWVCSITRPNVLFCMLGSEGGEVVMLLFAVRVPESIVNMWLPAKLTLCHGHCSIAVKKHYDLCNSYKRKHSIGGLLTVSAVSPLSIIMAGNVVACKQTWSWRSSWEMCILIHRQRERPWAWHELLKPQTHCQWHTYSKKAAPPNSYIPFRQSTPW